MRGTLTNEYRNALMQEYYVAQQQIDRNPANVKMWERERDCIVKILLGV